VRRLIALRTRHPGFRRRSYAKPEDITWLTPRGQPMQHDDWTRAETCTLGLLLLGKRLAERDDHGAPVEDDDLLLLLNAGAEPVEFELPDSGWQRVLDTFAPSSTVTNPYFLGPRALALLVKPR
jgi:isoamylase